MYRRCVALLALTVVLPLAAAARAAEPDAAYFPLKAGSVWTYRCGENRFQLKLVRFEKVGTVNCARLELIVNNKTEAAEQVAVTRDAVVRFSFDGKKAEPPIPFLRLPVKAGETWKVESKVDGQPLKGTFKSGTDDNVKVPAGTFKTATVTGADLEANGVKLSLTYYFAEKVGMVKQVIDVAGRKVIIELEKYEPGK